MLAFDAPSREECAANRDRSNIPQQALVLLNDPTYVEAARAFAARILREGGEKTGKRIDWAWREALCRKPRPEELSVVRRVLKRHLRRYERLPSEAKQLLQVGNTPAPADLPPEQLAAWTSVARILLNLHETITRS
jgi:hypothetical protein